MLRGYFWLFAGALLAVPAIGGCDPESLGSGGGTGGTSTGGTTVGGTGGETTSSTPTSTGYFIRIHYRLQDAGEVKSWGAHFWGAGSTSPNWGSPQLFDKTDDFGAYTDVVVTATEDKPDAWLGVLPVQCDAQQNCKKDVETGVRFFDLEKNAAEPNIAECWITQGQAVLTSKPMSTGPTSDITRPGDFIDLGNGSARMMFRVAPGSTGTLAFGAAAGTLDKKATWKETDNVNDNGLIIDGLTPGQKVYYKISSSLTPQGGTALTSETAVLDFTPVAFSPITQTADWAGWGAKGILYQLIVRTFADGGSPVAAADPGADSGIDPATRDGVGDLVGLRSMLPYLKDLGVDAVWMTPIFAAKSYHGYDTTNFYEIDPALGTRKDFEDLATDADALGINLILDLVQNHVADVNPWFVAGSDPKSPDYAKYHDWFVWSDAYSNMLADKHPWDASAVIWSCKNYMCYHQIFGTSMPELNYHNPEVRAEMKKIGEYWVKLGADGYRLDASKHIDQLDENHGIPLAVHGTHVWWKEFNYFVKKQLTLPAGAPAVLLAGENRWDDPAVYNLMVPYGSDMDSQFDFPFRSIVDNFVGGGTGSGADYITYMNKLDSDLFDPAKGGNPNHFFQRFLSNHDLDRAATQLEGIAPDPESVLKQASAIVLTSPGMPCIYYGEELGKKGKRDKYLGTEGWDHDEFIREPMSWYQDLTFSGDKMASWDIDFAASNTANVSLALDAGICKSPNPDYPYIKYMTETEPASWAAQKDDPASLYSWYKQLVAIRKANPVLTNHASTRSVIVDTSTIYEAKVEGNGAKVSIVLNRTATAQPVMRPVAEKDLITGQTATAFNVPPRGVLLLTAP